MQLCIIYFSSRAISVFEERMAKLNEYIDAVPSIPKLNGLDFCNAFSKLDLDDPVRQMPIQTLRMFVEGHARAFPEYGTAMPGFEEEMESTANSNQDKLTKFVLMVQMEKAMRVGSNFNKMRVALGPLEMKLQLRPGDLQCLHWKDTTKNSHTFHDIFQKALQGLHEDDHLMDLDLYELMNRVLYLGMQCPQQVLKYCTNLCIGNDGMLQPLLDFIKAI